jgi:hypothetical protein
MNSEIANQVSHEIKSALFEIQPDLYQLLQFHQISSTLEIHLLDVHAQVLDVHAQAVGSCWCRGVLQRPCQCAGGPDPEVLGLNPVKTQQLCTDVDSKLSLVLPRLSQFAQQMDESFEVHILIDPVTVSNSHISCRFVDGVLLCTDQLS